MALGMMSFLLMFMVTFAVVNAYNELVMDFPDLNFNEENNYLREFYGSTINQPSFVNPPRTVTHDKHIVTYNEHSTSDDKSNQNVIGNDYVDNKKQFGGDMSEYEPFNSNHHHHHHSHHEERIPVAVLSYHHHKYVEVPDHFVHYKPTVIDLDGKMYPIRLQFNSHSSPLVTNHRHHHHHQNHYEETSHTDEPHHHVHTIRKPIINEVREIITPYRHVYRVVKPMKENVRTYIHKHGKYHRHNHGHEYAQPQEYSEDIQAQKSPTLSTQTVQQLSPNSKYTFEEQPAKFTFENQATTELRPPIIQSSDESNF